jgi:DNA mismatch repair protein MutS2
VVDLLAEMRVQAFITTHFLRFASELHAARRASLSFLRVDLDANERPTYRFVPGVARTSLARQTAERLGVTREELGALVALKIRRAAEPEGARSSESEPLPDLDARGGTS